MLVLLKILKNSAFVSKLLDIGIIFILVMVVIGIFILAKRWNKNIGKKALALGPISNSKAQFLKLFDSG